MEILRRLFIAGTLLIAQMGAAPVCACPPSDAPPQPMPGAVCPMSQKAECHCCAELGGAAPSSWLQRAEQCQIEAAPSHDADSAKQTLESPQAEVSLPTSQDGIVHAPISAPCPVCSTLPETKVRAPDGGIHDEKVSEDRRRH